LIGLKIIQTLCGRFKCQPDTIAVITFYARQVELFQHYIAEYGIKGIDVNTVDGFQGREKDIVILSFVRSNEMSNIGFVQDYRRLNVALTRARHALIMLGNRNTLLESKKEPAALIEDLETRNLVFQASEVEKNMSLLQAFQQTKRRGKGRGKGRGNIPKEGSNQRSPGSKNFGHQNTQIGNSARRPSPSSSDSKAATRGRKKDGVIYRKPRQQGMYKPTSNVQQPFSNN
jgi:hypothetical protein